MDKAKIYFSNHLFYVFSALFISLLFSFSGYSQTTGSRGRFAPEPLDTESIISQSKKYAVIIGVNQYGTGVPHLKGCVNDAHAMAEAFTDLGFEVKVFTDQTEPMAKKSSIEQAVSTMANNAGPTDTILFSFAGHGAVNPESVKNPAELPQGFLLPTKFGIESSFLDEAVSIQRIKDLFYQSRAQFRLIFFDACHSGSQMYVIPGRNEDGTMSDSFYRSMKGSDDVEERGLYVFSSCLQSQLAYENRETNHGFFTSYVIRGLEGAAADYEGEISVYGLVDYVSKNTQKTVQNQVGERQTPQLLSEGIRMVLGQVPLDQVSMTVPQEIITLTIAGYSYLADGILAEFNAVNDAYSSAALEVLASINPDVENYPQSLDKVLVRASQFILNKRSPQKILSSKPIDSDFYEVEIEAQVDKIGLMSVAAEYGLIPYSVMRQHGLIDEVRAGLYIPTTSSNAFHDDRVRETIASVFQRLEIPFDPQVSNPSQMGSSNTLIIEANYDVEEMEKRGRLFQSAVTLGLKSYPTENPQSWLASLDTGTEIGLGASQNQADEYAFAAFGDDLERFVYQTIAGLMDQN